MNTARAAVGSVVFLIVAPGAVAGLVLWLLTGWSTRDWWLPVRLLGAMVIAGGPSVLLHAFARFVVEGIGTPAPVAPTERLVVGGRSQPDGNVEARELLEQRSVQVIAGVHSSSPKDGTIPKERFAIDLQTDTVTCPQDHTTPIYKPRANRRTTTGERVARFAREACEPCPLRPRCAPGGQRDIRIRRREDLRQAALRALSNPAEREHLNRTRPRIERLLGLIVHRYHGRKSRYLGARKSMLQAVWTAVLVNLHPIGAALRAQVA